MPRRATAGDRLESSYYQQIKEALENLFVRKYGDRLTAILFEVTARGEFSQSLKSQVQPGRDIIFVFLRQNPPDMTGFLSIKEDYMNSGFVVVEFKREALKLEDIYQMKRYADLFNARHAFLVSLQPIPEEIKRLDQAIPHILYLTGSSRRLTMATFDESVKVFHQWYPENPFASA